MNLEQLRELKKNQQQKSLGKAYRLGQGEFTPSCREELNGDTDWVPSGVIKVDEDTTMINLRCNKCGKSPEGIFAIFQRSPLENKEEVFSFAADACPFCGAQMRIDKNKLKVIGG